MSSESLTTPDTEDSAQHARANASKPWITTLAVTSCIGIFLGLTVQDDYESWESVAKFGYLPAHAVWDGGYWSLVSSAFVHFEIWHIAFNMYWLWVLGSRLEKAIGSLPFLGFVVLSAFVSSSFQLAVSDSAGIGASGVVYALFGFMWPTRRRYPQFNQVLDDRIIQFFLIWLVGCVVATHLDIWNVGNAAHISGLLFGSAVAGAFALHYKRRLIRCGLATLITLSIIPLVWCPWSVTWLSHQAYNAHVDERYDAALDHYTRVIHMHPDEAWAYLNRSYVYEELGELEKARADWQKAREIDPSIENWE